MMERTPDHETSDLGINNTNSTTSHHVTLPGLNNTSQAPNNQQSSLLQDQVDSRPAVLDKSLRNEYTRLYGSIDQEKLLASTTQLIMDQEINSKEAPLENGAENHLQECHNQQNNYDSTSQSQDNTNPLIPNDENSLNDKNGGENNEKSNKNAENESNCLKEERKNSSVGVESQEDEGEWSPSADPDLMERTDEGEGEQDEEEGEEEGGDYTLTEEEENFTDYIDSETDYENEHIIQYQAAIVAGLIDDERQCWVCFASDEDDPTAVWVHPCRCSGTTKWVHHVCLQRWVDEKQKGNNTANVSCPQCGTEYIIRFPPSGPIMKILDGLDLLIGRMCPLIAGGILVGGTFWSFVTYGAVTVMQVAGHDEGWSLMEATDPLLLLVSLPLIPIGLFLGKMVKWQDPVLKVFRTYLPQVPVTRYVLPAFAEVPEREGSGAAASLPPSSDPVSVTRTFCGALIFPTIATFLGGALYPETPSPVRRALLGGLTFIVVKGVLKVYHKQHQYIRQSRRVIDNFDPNNATQLSVNSE